MKRIMIIFIVLLSLLFTGCGISNASSKALDEGKISIVSKEYEKARDLFELAINEDDKNTEAKELLELTNDYIELLSALEVYDFSNTDTLISRIENNKNLDLIKNDFFNTKNAIEENKEKIANCTKEIEVIDTLLTENKIDDAKNQAITKLEEVKGIKPLEDRLNGIIIAVDEKIANAKAEIFKYYNGSYDIKYKNMEIYNNSEVEELNGKAVIHFVEDQNYGSPHTYIYRMEDGGLFRIDQGSIYWVNNENKEIYTVNSHAQDNISYSNNGQSDYFTVDDAIREASKKFEEDFPLEKGNYQAKSNGVISAGCYEVEFFDKGGRLFFGAYAFDVKSGVTFRI